MPDHIAELADALCFLAEFDEGHTFAEMRGLELETPRVVSKDLIEFRDGLLILFLLVGDFTEIELRVGGARGIAVVLNECLGVLAGEIRSAPGHTTSGAALH